MVKYSLLFLFYHVFAFCMNMAFDSMALSVYSQMTLMSGPVMCVIAVNFNDTENCTGKYEIHRRQCMREKKKERRESNLRRKMNHPQDYH